MIQIAERVLRRASLPVLLAVGVIVTVPGNWLRVQNVDPQFAMVLVQRTIHFGGTFFDNAVQDHGPIEPFLYDIAARLGGRVGSWYVISAIVTGVSIFLGYVAARTARLAGATRDVGIAVGAAVFVHFTISRSNYAGVFYIRNMTTVLLAVVWWLIIDDRVWSSARRRRVGALAVGCVLGLAVQSLLATFAAGVLGLVAIGTVWSRVELRERLPLAAIMSGSAFATFVSAPLYYLARGDFTEFWSGWVQYGRYMAVGPGRSTSYQLHQGWTTLVRYYEHRPLAWAVILAFTVALVGSWSTDRARQRMIKIGLIAWWIAAWIELALSQRYSAEYYVVTSVPTALMAATLAGLAWRGLRWLRVPARAAVALPLVVAIVGVCLSSTTNFDNDVRSAWRFRGVGAKTESVEKNRNGNELSAIAVLDLVSHDGDPLLVWTDDPWPYLSLKRVAATRFFYKSFLLGEIYLGRTSRDYVLPQTWKWFSQDLRQSEPVAYVRADQPKGPKGNPFASYVAHNFDSVLPNKDLPVSLRRAAARQVLEPSAARDWAGRAPNVSNTGWKIVGTAASYTRGPVASGNDQLTLSTGSCFRLDGHITADKAGSLGPVVFHFYDNFAKVEPLKISFSGAEAESASNHAKFLRLPTNIRPNTPQVPFSLVVGRRSAAFVVNGQVRAALLLSKSATVTAESTAPSLELSDLRVGDAPAGSGC